MTLKFEKKVPTIVWFGMGKPTFQVWNLDREPEPPQSLVGVKEDTAF